MIDKDLRKQYSEMTKKEVKREIKLIKKEMKPLYYQVNCAEECLGYLNHKLV